MQPTFRIWPAFLASLSVLAYAGQLPGATAQPFSGSGQNSSSPLTRPSTTDENTPSGGSPIRLDVVVTDKAGKLVSGLVSSDFTLLDNNQPARVLSFEAHAGTPQPESSVKVLLLVDAMNATFDSVSYTRGAVEKFLRQDGGHLPVPVSVDWITEKGIRAQSSPVLDGNSLADQFAPTEARLRTITQSQGVYGALDRLEISLQILRKLAESEADGSDKKLVIWIGPGWPMLDGPGIDISYEAETKLFRNIVFLSDSLRRSRVSLYSVTQGQADRSTFLYQEYLKGVTKIEKAQFPDLSLKVLSVQSGGLALPPSNDLVQSIRRCVEDGAIFYTLSFAPPPADRPDEYHALKIRIDKPGLTARTTTGYYAQPSVRGAP